MRDKTVMCTNLGMYLSLSMMDYECIVTEMKMSATCLTLRVLVFFEGVVGNCKHVGLRSLECE